MQDHIISIEKVKKSDEAEIVRLKAYIEKFKDDLKDLREMNQKLSKKHHETNWIAKSEHEKLEKQLKNVVKDKFLNNQQHKPVTD